MTAGEVAQQRRRMSRRWLLVLLLIVLLGVVALWLSRVPIASGVIDRTFAASDVPASYRIDNLGVRRQRLTNVVIGDPANPDLVADWIETRIALRGGVPALDAVRAGHVRLRGRLADGRLSLGAIDRLLPAPSGEPFALPALGVDVEDARMRLETPLGVVGLRLSGRGRLDQDFRGTLAAVAPGVTVGDCAIQRPTAFLDVRVREAAPHVAGPLRAAALSCAGIRAEQPAARLDARLNAALTHWSGSAALRSGAISGSGARTASLTGQLDFTGDKTRTEGRAQLRGEQLRVAGASSRQAGFAGTWRLAGGRAIVAGRFDGQNVALPSAMQRQLAVAGDSAAGTPLAPLATAAGTALARAGADFTITGEAAFGTATNRPLATLRELTVRSASGARLQFGEGGEVILGHPAGIRANGTLRLSGGGLPEATVRVAQQRAGGPISGGAQVAPYAAGGARLALTPARFTAAPDGRTSLQAIATLTGPLSGGAVEELRVPLAAQLDEHGALTLNRACADASFTRLALSGLALRNIRLALCPVDGAMFRLARGGVGGGIAIASPQLTGTLGGTPLQVRAARAEWRHAGASFALDDVAARIGRAGNVTRLDFGRLVGRVASGDILGTFAGGSGRIGAVPLQLADAAGDWRFAASVLSLDGALSVSDTADSARFRPLAARTVTLRLADNVITADGELFEPAKNVKVANVAIRHQLSSGAGNARLDVPGITFGDGFQPEELTPLTFGVIADVRGSVRGVGNIDWSPDGVTSTGTFATDQLDLAAAFGPVAGIKGQLRFTDLLALESAPNQTVTVAEINPGVAVTDGVIDYQLLRDLRVKVNGGVWPFASGTLTLRPTLLDFSSPQERHMTFLIEGMEARHFLQKFDFKNLDATGVADGVLPMIFDQSGGRIEDGRLVMREGGGSIAYLGELTEEDLGTWGNIAFQALRSLRYRNLELVMNGPLAGEMVTEVKFAGISQGEGAKSNFLIRRLQKLPFVFNIRITAPFRGLIDSVASFYDPKRLIDRNLPALIEEQNRRAQPLPNQPPARQPPAIQPSASEMMP